MHLLSTRLAPGQELTVHSVKSKGAQNLKRNGIIPNKSSILTAISLGRYTSACTELVDPSASQASQHGEGWGARGFLSTACAFFDVYIEK